MEHAHSEIGIGDRMRVRDNGIEGTVHNLFGRCGQTYPPHIAILDRGPGLSRYVDLVANMVRA
jgi:hypothetical protein